jgi:subtilase family serine protease
MKNNTLALHGTGRWFGKTIITLASGAMLLVLSSPCLAAERQVLRGHVPQAIARLNLQPVGRLPATNRLRLAIGLPLRNTNALNKLLQDMYDPASPQFRRYLTPEQFTEKFGPTQQDYDAVAQFAKSHGLEITTIHSNHALLDVAGQVADIEKAFQITLRTYQHPREPRQFYAPDVEPSVEAGLAVLDISGLNNFSLPRPASPRTSVTSAGRGAAGSGTNGSYMGKDFRNAYAPGVTLTGAGQMLGLVEFEGFYTNDIKKYESMAGLPNVPIQIVLLDGFNGIPVTSDSHGILEASVDVEMAICMTPGLSNLVVFNEGPNAGYILPDILNAMAANPQIKQLSCSWAPLGESTASDNILKQMALQGQSFFQDSGDGDSWVNNVSLPTWWDGYLGESAFWPSDDPYVTSVGGTSLTMNGSGASYASEQVWNQGNDWPGWYGSGYEGSGGGISPGYAIPAWQQSLEMSASRGSTFMRNFPDVAIVADGFVIVAYDGSTMTGISGTSLAAPLWAGFTALVNQEAAANGQPSVGFLNPALYAIGKSTDYTNCFHDITVGNNATPTSDGLFPAVAGYDLCTGWGSPNGSNLIYALAFPESLVVAPSSDQQFSGPVGGPLNPGALSYSLTNSPAYQNPSLGWSVSLDAG